MCEHCIHDNHHNDDDDDDDDATHDDSVDVDIDNIDDDYFVHNITRY